MLPKIPPPDGLQTAAVTVSYRQSFRTLQERRMATITNTTPVRRAPKKCNWSAHFGQLTSNARSYRCEPWPVLRSGYPFPRSHHLARIWSEANCRRKRVYLWVGCVALATIRISPRRAHLSILASIGLLLSLGLPISAGFGFGPPGTPAAGVATVITLSLMHIVSFVICVPLFIRMALD